MIDKTPKSGVEFESFDGSLYRTRRLKPCKVVPLDSNMMNAKRHPVRVSQAPASVLTVTMAIDSRVVTLVW
jgi:hypothetical protein